VLERGSFTYFAAITTTTTNSRKCFRKLHRCIENQIKVENIGLSLTNIWNSKPIHEFSKKHCASTFAYNNKNNNSNINVNSLNNNNNNKKVNKR